MVAFQLAACTLLLTGNILQTSALDTYIAAVYEHAVILSGATTALVSREDALKLMNKNLDILEGAIKTAAEQGAHIIVTPEDGVFGWVFTRDSIYSYLENIPDPQVNWNPCIEPGRGTNGGLKGEMCQEERASSQPRPGPPSTWKPMSSLRENMRVKNRSLQPPKNPPPRYQGWKTIVLELRGIA
uniref:CN hydrolase domain-containing protein n=1 Tax=Anolis carolinensis TaxID=28377 RepID=A0A803T464_ANOCA